MPFLCLEHTSGPLVPEFLALNLNSLWPSMCLICSVIFCCSLQSFIYCLVKLTVFLSSTSSQSTIPICLGTGDSQNSDYSALELGKFQGEPETTYNVLQPLYFSPKSPILEIYICSSLSKQHWSFKKSYFEQF